MAYAVGMAVQVGAPRGRAARMWRKVVAFRHDQRERLRTLAENDPGTHGNSSEVIRAAVDEYLARHEGAQNG